MGCVCNSVVQCWPRMHLAVGVISRNLKKQTNLIAVTFHTLHRLRVEKWLNVGHRKDKDFRCKVNIAKSHGNPTFVLVSVERFCRRQIGYKYVISENIFISAMRCLKILKRFSHVVVVFSKCKTNLLVGSAIVCSLVHRWNYWRVSTLYVIVLPSLIFHGNCS